MVKVKPASEWSFEETGSCLYWLLACRKEGLDLEDAIATTENMYLLKRAQLSKKGVKK